jgi:hypothetical protein
MANRDPHPAIRWVASQDGWGEQDEVNHDAFALVQASKMLYRTPQQRAQELQNIDQLIGRDDGSTLRSKSELVELRRHLGPCIPECSGLVGDGSTWASYSALQCAGIGRE